MLESLKDLYISYPFLPILNPPDFFQHIKDIHVVLELPAQDLLLGYKNNRNGNYVRAWLTALVSADGDIDAYAEVKVQCSQVQDELFTVKLPFIDWTGGVPHTANWLMCDNELLEDLSSIEAFTPYELNPDVLVLMQKAPALYKGKAKLDHTLHVGNGHNTTVTLSNGQLAFYGASGVGSGLYGMNTPFALSDDKQAAGLRSINGLTGDVRIEGTYPVRLDHSKIEGDKLILEITVEAANDQD